MNRLFYFLLLAAFVASCSDEIEQVTVQSTPQVLTRAGYDEGAFQWDNVDYFNYRLESDEIKTNLSVPWKPGIASAMGIPQDWVDFNYLDSDPYKRKYSEANGWKLVYSNLYEKSDHIKYFALYNKYTGIMRLFTYTFGTNNTANGRAVQLGIYLSGNSSVLNFCEEFPTGMSERKNGAAFYYIPKSCIFTSSMATSFSQNQWYGMEVELAYDSSVTDSNLFSFALQSQNITNITLGGSIAGSITGTVTTVFSNTPNFNFSIDNSKNCSINQSISDAGDNIKNTINNGLNSADTTKKNFWESIWNKIKTTTSGLAGKTVNEGIDAILSAGSSFATKKLGHLAKSILGIGGPMSSESKVNLGANLTLEISGSATDSIIQLNVNNIPLPGGNYPNVLYNEKLGAWNLSSNPIVYTDMHAYSYYYAQNPDRTRPVATQATFRYYLSYPTIVIKPVISNEFDVTNTKFDLVVDDKVTLTYNEALDMNSLSAYGFFGDTYLYSSTNSYLTLYAISLDGKRVDSTVESYYERDWPSGLSYATNYLFCRVSFDLVSKNDDRVYSFSKYFRVTPQRRNFYHHNKDI